ncbi:MAG: alanine/glycine:cation symporter family protein [Bacteroidales bacterium]|nr:alanine/glycine:cation symporter family protein [Bacteroidales bacterium]MDD4671016.1 alanine/glycine:cation symporter family protein [Bacteroidales bacterium]
MNEFFTSIGNGITVVSDFICGYPLFFLLIGGGLFFLIYSKFVPLRYYGRAIQSLRVKDDKADGQISSFEALTSAIAATVGMGNIAGVAIALSIGGPGAIFWMWISAIVGMATKFFEGTLAVMYKGKDSAGEVQGGPMYMITTGLGKKWKPMAVFFSIFGLIGTLCIMQANQLTEAVTTVFFAPEDNTLMLRFLIGVGICAIVSVVVIGGIKRISKVSTKIVPLMVAMYFILVLYIICTHLPAIPGVFKAIVVEAFTVKAGIGGGIGGLVAIAMIGVRRAALVNEAGVGTASMMHGASKNNEPVREGLVAMIGPSIDSGLVCTLTAIAILIQRDLIPVGSGMNSMEGLKVAINAFDASIPGVGRYLLLLMVFIFAFSTMFSYSYYGQKCTGYLFGAKNAKYYNIFFLLMLIVAAMIPLKAAVGLIDTAYALMAFPTMLTLLILAPKAKEQMNIYFTKTKKVKKDKNI